MDKKKIDSLLSDAYDIIQKKFPTAVPKEFKGYVDSFGAAVTMGSLLAAVAFIGREKDGVDRTKLPLMIAELVSKAELKPCGKDQTLFEYVKTQPDDPQVRENILKATIAIKLALKLFPVEKEGKEHAETQLETES